MLGFGKSKIRILTDIVESQQKMISELTSKLMSKDFQQYTIYNPERVSEERRNEVLEHSQTSKIGTVEYETEQ